MYAIFLTELLLIKSYFWSDTTGIVVLSCEIGIGIMLFCMAVFTCHLLRSQILLGNKPVTIKCIAIN